MNSFYIAFIVFLSINISCSGHHKNQGLEPINIKESNSIKNNNLQSMQQMKITVGSTIFIANLLDNPTTQAFKKLLPLTLDMSDLNDNEKYFYLSTNLPTKSSVGGNIKAGDIMLYGNNCLVLFYEGLNSSYSYTKMGHIENISGLIEALGNGKVIIKFEIV